MAISKRLRYEVFRRDNHACRYCGRAAPEVKLTADHVIPVALGGTDEPSNLVTACADCNSGKSSSSPDAPLVEDVAADALRWAAAMRRAAELQLDDIEAEYDHHDAVLDHWRIYTTDPNLPFGWRTSISNFYRAGLGKAELRYAAQQALTAPHIPSERSWQYFCGICWRMVEQRRQIAASLLTAEEGETPA